MDCCDQSSVELQSVQPKFHLYITAIACGFQLGGWRGNQSSDSSILRSLVCPTPAGIQWRIWYQERERERGREREREREKTFMNTDELYHTTESLYRVIYQWMHMFQVSCKTVRAVYMPSINYELMGCRREISKRFSGQKFYQKFSMVPQLGGGIAVSTPETELILFWRKAKSFFSLSLSLWQRCEPLCDLVPNCRWKTFWQNQEGLWSCSASLPSGKSSNQLQLPASQTWLHPSYQR